MRLLAILLVLQLSCISAQADSLYSQSVAIPEDSGPALKTAAVDAAKVLLEMTGREFVVGSDYADGIQLIKSTSPLAPSDAKAWLKDKGREPFVIRSNNGDKLLIVANRDEGLTHGLYFYLEQLGARFYFPSEKWTIIPDRKDVTLKIDRKMLPDFELREFFGTGGFGPALPNDPKQEIKARWEQWKIRNRFGGEFRLGGHSGEAFNVANKETLLKHPEYLAKVDGEHVPWSLIAKLNTANKDAVQLYVDWTVERFRVARQRDPKGRGSFAVSVDPSDGGEHCNSPECGAIGNGSASDQVFYVANQAAKAVAKEFPGAYVNLYGYNEHAMPPTIPLEPNIHVMIIPYAFQRTELTPEEFIAAWGKKVNRMGLYDYWSIPDWTHDVPDFNYLKTPRDKLKFWHESNISSVLSESTFSSGAIGLAWYVGSRLMWELNTDENVIIEEFYAKAFGPAAPPMKRMLERWANGFMLTSNELALSFRDLQQATQQAKTREVRARLADYGRYLEYLRLHFAWRQASREEKPEANRELVRHAWNIYDSSMIHAYRIYQLQARSDKELRDSYNPKDDDAPAWKSIDPPTDADIFAAIENGVQQFEPLGYMPQRFSGELVPVNADGATPTLEKLPALVLVGQSSFQFLAKPGQSTFPLKFRSATPVRIQLKDDAGKMLLEKTIERDAALAKDDWQQLALKLPSPSHYRVNLIILKNDNITLQLPVDFLTSFSNFRTGKPLRSPRLYFYVPNGLKKLTIYQPLPLPEIMEIHFFDPAGNKILPQTHDNRTTYIVEIPDGMDGKVWSLDNLVSPNESIHMLNAPQSFSLYPSTLLVPQYALQ